MQKANIWSQSVARRSLVGSERTNNPTPAAYALTGRQRVKRAFKALKRKGKRRAHKGNPLPAVVGVLGGLKGLGKIGKRLQSRDARDAERFARADALAARAALGDSAALTELERLSREFATQRAKEHALGRLAEVRAGATQRAAAPAPQTGLAGFLATPGAAGIVRTLAAKPRRAASRRGRYPTYVDRQGRQRYSSKPPGSELRIPAGATPTPGTPYNFFRGAVGRGGALATAGQVAVAAGAGIGAYLVTQRLLQHLGGKAQRAEEAGVNAALAFRQARADFKQQQGRNPTAAEVREMGDAYQAQLIEMGYDPQTFTRTRSRAAQFFETYNPFGG